MAKISQWQSTMLGLMAIGLSACVSSEAPLIAYNDSVFPFDSLLIETAEGDWVIIERLGDAYVQTYGKVPARFTAPHGVVSYRFAAIDDDHFLLQASGLLDGNRFLYAVARIDPQTGKVVIIADGTPFEGDGGLRKCEGDTSDFCVFDLSAFSQSARSYISQVPRDEFIYRILRTRGAGDVAWSRDQQAPPLFVEAFRLASQNLTPRQAAVVDGMTTETTLESLVATGTIETPYDCLPEHRILCHEVLSQRTRDTVIFEWGEWHDNLDRDQTTAFVSELMNDAAALGFNLLTNQELSRGSVAGQGR